MATGELSLGIVIGAALSSSFKSSFDTSKKSIAYLSGGAIGSVQISIMNIITVLHL